MYLQLDGILINQIYCVYAYFLVVACNSLHPHGQVIQGKHDLLFKIYFYIIVSKSVFTALVTCSYILICSVELGIYKERKA